MFTKWAFRRDEARLFELWDFFWLSAAARYLKIDGRVAKIGVPITHQLRRTYRTYPAGLPFLSRLPQLGATLPHAPGARIT